MRLAACCDSSRGKRSTLCHDMYAQTSMNTEINDTVWTMLAMVPRRMYRAGKKARQTYLSCPDCRQMPSLVRIIIAEIVDVKHTFNACLMTNNRLVSELNCKYAECEELKQDNTTLRDRVRDVSNAHNQEA